MKGLILLLCCIGMMGTVISGDNNTSTDDESMSGEGPIGLDDVSNVNTTTQEDNSTRNSTAIAVSISPPETSEASSFWKADTSTAPTPSPISHHAPTSSGTTPIHSTVDCMFDRKVGVILLLVTGALIILCSILLLSTLALVCKVCQLSRHIHNDADLISNPEYWMGTARSNKGKPEAKANEINVLMSCNFSQTQEETSTGPVREEERKVNKDARTEEEEEEEEEEDTPSIHHASANGTGKGIAVSAHSPSSKTPMDITDSPPTKVIAASSSSEGSEKPKDGV